MEINTFHREKYTTSRHIYHQIGGIYVIMSDINMLYDIPLKQGKKNG